MSSLVPMGDDNSLFIGHLRPGKDQDAILFTIYNLYINVYYGKLNYGYWYAQPVIE